MIFKQNKKVCKCGRDTTHEHKTMERYLIIEKDKEGNISEIFDHGYDGEDDRIQDFLQEVRRDNKDTRISYKLIRVEEI